MFINNRIDDMLNKMTTEEKYKLLDKIETKNLGHNENMDSDFIESIVNILLDTTTILAKLLHII